MGIYNGNQEIVKYLVSIVGCDADKQDSNGHNALWHSINNTRTDKRHYSIYQWLQEWMYNKNSNRNDDDNDNGDVNKQINTSTKPKSTDLNFQFWIYSMREKEIIYTDKIWLFGGNGAVY